MSLLDKRIKGVSKIGFLRRLRSGFKIFHRVQDPFDKLRAGKAEVRFEPEE